MKKLKTVIVCLIALIILASVPTVALAEDEQKALASIPAVGVAPASASCPLTVTDAIFNFNINEFPEDGMNLAELDSYVEATYTVSNETEDDVTAEMSLILGTAPEYGTNAFAEGTSSVKANDAAVETVERISDDVHILDFSITVVAGGTLSMVAVFPVYPGTEPTYTPMVYSYSLSTEGLKDWKQVKKFTVNINTPFYAVGSNIYGFENKKELKAEYVSIPNEDFSIFLSTVKKPKNPTIAWAIVLIVVIMVLIVFGPIVLTLIIVNAVNKARKHKQKERFENRYNIYK